MRKGERSLHGRDRTLLGHEQELAYDRQWEAIVAARASVQRDIGAENLIDRLRPEVHRFLCDHEDRTGAIVVKTSTASLRNKNHEPDELLLAALLELVSQAFPTRRLILTDGPAHKPVFKHIAEQHGWHRLAEKYGADIIDLNTEPAIAILGDSIGVSVAEICRDAALTISVGKAKTHRRTGISGAEKASIGYLSGEQMGYPKLECRHWLLPPIYAAIQELAAPTLHVIDGINPIQGDGPMAGTPMDGRFLLVGRNPTVLDIELSALYHFDPALIISLFHPLSRPDASAVTTANGVGQAMLITTEQTLELLGKSPARPPKEQPWLFRSLSKQGSRRNRRNFAKIQEAFADVYRS